MQPNLKVCAFYAGEINFMYKKLMEESKYGKMFLCQKDADVEYFRNPYTNEIHPTCGQCKIGFTAFLKERLLFTKLSLIWIPIFILISIIVTFFNLKLGFFLIVVGAIFEFIAIKLQEYFVRKKGIAVSSSRINSGK